MFVLIEISSNFKGKQIGKTMFLIIKWPSIISELRELEIQTFLVLANTKYKESTGR